MNKANIVSLMILVLIATNCIAGRVTFNPAGYSMFEMSSDLKREIIENQMKPIIENFELEIDPTVFEECCCERDSEPYGGYGAHIWTDTGEFVTRDEILELSKCKNSIQIHADLGLSLNDLSKWTYTIIRNGKELNEIKDSFRVGDIIRFKPLESIKMPKSSTIYPEGDTGAIGDIIQIAAHGRDWIVQGASNDTPPINIISKPEYNKKIKPLIEKYDERYPCNSMWRRWGTGTARGVSPYLDITCVSPIPKFEPKIEQFNETATYYTAENGYKAFIVPIRGGKKASVQIFCIPTLRVPTKYCKENDFGGADCEVYWQGAQSSQQEISINPGMYCRVYIDKFIIKGKAIEAGWFDDARTQEEWLESGDWSEWLFRGHVSWMSGFEKEFYIQVIPEGKQPPVAVVNCHVTEDASTLEYYPRLHDRPVQKETWPKIIVCDASDSYDPDGQVEEYRYFFKHIPSWGPRYELPIWEALGEGVFSIRLYVFDNDGLYDYTTTTVDSRGETLKYLEAYFDSESKMAQITPECGQETILIDIENAITGKTEIDKAEIPCNETTPIGPFTAKGAFKVIGTNHEETKEAIFTV